MNDYKQARARGLCCDCRQVPSVGARCGNCAAALSERRYSIDIHRPPATLEEIGAALGLTSERVRQIEGIAIAKVTRRLGLDRRDALMGLAMLGCQSRERYAEPVRPVVKYEKVHVEAAACFGVGSIAGNCSKPVVDHPRRGPRYCARCNATMDTWGAEVRKYTGALVNAELGAA